MNRWKNVAMWSSLLIGFIPLVVDSLGFYDIDIMLPDNWESLVKAGLALLVGFGILNNPTTQNKGFFDDKSKD